MGLYNNTAETERLLTENYERYYRLAFKLMRNQDDALDVVQESAYRAIKDCKGVRNKDYLSTWIYRIVVNTSLDMLRRKKKETPTEEMPETPTEDHYQDLDLKQMINRLDDKSRTDYESRPVPTEAKERMLAGIAQAKKEQKGVIIMKFAKKTGGAAAAAMIAITVLANATPALANAMEQIPVIGSIAKVVTFRTYEDKKDNFEADIKVPQVTIEGTEGAQVPANKSIEDYGNELIAMYEEELSRDNGEGHYGLDSQYEVVTDNSKYLSIRIDTTLTMASGTQFVKVFTIDKATGSIISLKDLFHDRPEMLEAVSDNIKSQMAQQMAKDDSVVYFYQSDMPDEDFKGLTGDESYYFNENGELVITFNEYDVAPGYMGAVQFTIPGSVTGTF